jgi:hypothetical protein
MMQQGAFSPDFSELGTGNIGGKKTQGLYKWTNTVTALQT